MAMTGRTLLGVFDEPAMADQAVDALRAAGFRNDQILIPEHRTSGGFMSGLKSFFGGEEASDITDDLTAMGVSPDEAEYYENEHQAGRTVVAVQSEGREQEAMEILRTNGAQSYMSQSGIASTDAPRANTLQAVDTSNATTTSAVQVSNAADTTDPQVLRLREERLNASKQQVQTGEVNLRKEVISEQQTINVPVTHEEAFVERHDVTDVQIDNSTPIGDNESIRVPLSEARVNVSKDTYVTGEVSIGKRAVTETQQVTDTVQHEEAHVEQQGDAPIHGTTSDQVHPDSVDKNTL